MLYLREIIDLHQILKIFKTRAKMSSVPKWPFDAPPLKLIKQTKILSPEESNIKTLKGF